MSGNKLSEIRDCRSVERWFTDSYIFEDFLPKWYKPSDEPLCMAVGVANDTEAKALRFFHNSYFKIPREKIKVAGCDLDRMHEIYELEYDFLICDREDGDARNEYVWHEIAYKMGRKDFPPYDISVIRNPDLVSIGEWKRIFLNAFKFTKESGVVCTIIRECDVRKYEKLLEAIKKGNNIEPVYSGPTGIEAEDNFVHTIGIFKPPHKHEGANDEENKEVFGHKKNS